MDSENFFRITDKYLDIVYRAAFSCCKNKSDAEDAVQNSFLKLLNYDEDFENDEHIKRWLIRVAVNECKNIRKSFWYRKKISFDDLEKEPFCDDNYSELLSVLAKLPHNYSAVIHLYYYENYSVREISEILNISQSNVQIRLMRARNKLREFLTEE